MGSVTQLKILNKADHVLLYANALGKDMNLSIPERDS